jgi:hypothetical protein
VFGEGLVRFLARLPSNYIMKNKPLLYGLFGFIIGSSLTLWLMLDGRATQSQVAEGGRPEQSPVQSRTSAAYDSLPSTPDQNY